LGLSFVLLSFHSSNRRSIEFIENSPEDLLQHNLWMIGAKNIAESKEYFGLEEARLKGEARQAQRIFRLLSFGPLRAFFFASPATWDWVPLSLSVSIQVESVYPERGNEDQPLHDLSHMLSQFLESRRHEAQRIWGSAELRFLSLSGTWAKEVLCSRGRLNCTWVWKSIIRLNRLHSISAGSSIHYARIDEFFPFSGQFRLGHPLNWSRPPCLSLYFLLWIERFQDWLTRLTFFFCLTFHRPTY